MDLVDGLWAQIESSIRSLALAYERVRVYQDGVPVCGRELKIVTELAEARSGNRRLLLHLREHGPTMMGTESSELLVEEYQLSKELFGLGIKGAFAAGEARRRALRDSLLRRRDQFIARRIGETLLRGETGLLFLGMLHRVEPWLDKDTDPSVPVVTEEPKTRELGEAAGLGVVNARTLRALVNEIRRTEAAEAAKAAAAGKSANIRERRRFLLIVFAGFVLAGLGVLAWEYIEEIVRTVTVWGTLAALPIVGVCLYALRGRFRITYGVAELTIGFLTAAKVFAPTFNFGTVGWRDLLSILAGLYVVVRGLDNVGKALEATPYDSAWRRLSGETRKS